MYWIQKYLSLQYNKSWNTKYILGNVRFNIENK